MLRKYFKDAFWIGFTNLILQLKGLVLIPLLSKKFGAVGYGAWAQVAVLVGMLSPVVGMGIGQGYGRFMPARNRREQAEFLWTNIWIHALMSVICFGLLWIAAKPLASFLVESASEYPLIYACGLVISSNLLVNDVQAFFRVGQNVKAMNIVILVRGFGNLVVVLAIYVAGGGVLGIVLAGGVFDLVVALSCLVAIAQRYAISGIDQAMARKFFAFGWVLIPTGYTMWVINASDRLFLAHYGNLKNIGIYSAMYALGYGLIPLVVRPFRAMYPVVAASLYDSDDLRGIQRLFEHSTKAVLFFVIMTFAVLLLFAKDIAGVFTAKEFLRGSLIIPIIFLSYVVNVFASYYGVNLGLRSKQRILTYSLAIACAANILLNFVLIPQFGIYGAAASTLIAFTIDLLICMYYGNKIVKLSIDKKFLIKCLSVSFLVVVSVSRFSFVVDNFYKMIIIFFSLLCIYTAGCLCLNTFSKEEIKLIIKSVTG